MYPSIMRQEMFPCKLISYREDMSVSGLLDLSNHYGVIADVLIQARVPEYPYRSGERVTYPVGRFRTALTGPELLKLSSDGEIIRCHAASVYRMGRPFVQYVDKLLSERALSRSAGDVTREAFIKHLSNSLAGKLAQMSGGWERTPSEDEPGVWGESFRINYDTGATVKFRHICGIAWKWVPDKTGRGPFTAAFAYLSAYGRLMMRAIRSLSPPRTVVSQDTDGLWVLPAGIEAIASGWSQVGGEPGQLRIAGSARTARWFGPRHYYIDGRWILSGFHQPRPGTNHLTMIERVDTTLWDSRTTEAPSETTHYDRVKAIPLEIAGQTVGSDGWCLPARFSRLPI